MGTVPVRQGGDLRQRQDRGLERTRGEAAALITGRVSACCHVLRVKGLRHTGIAALTPTAATGVPAA